MVGAVAVAQVAPEGAGGSTRGEAGDRSRGHRQGVVHAARLRRREARRFDGVGWVAGSLEREGFCRGR